MKSLMGRFLSNPVAFTKRAIDKLVVGPMRYGKTDDYDAPKYWADRFQKYGGSILGPGDEGLSAAENEEMYRAAAGDFRRLLEGLGLDLKACNVLEVGCGTGFYTDILRTTGVEQYTALDITDVQFASHRERFPGYSFVKADVSECRLEQKFDLIVMIDVTQHIVNRKKFDAAMQNLYGALRPGGTFIVGPLMAEQKEHLYYVHFWSLADVERGFQNSTIAGVIEFRTGMLYSLRLAS